MKDLQNLSIGDVVYYAGKSRKIKDWYCFKDKQFANDGTTIYAIPILDDGQLLDWIYWDEVMTWQDVIDILGEENLKP